jgi:hypothetical protein
MERTEPYLTDHGWCEEARDVLEALTPAIAQELRDQRAELIAQHRK